MMRQNEAGFTVIEAMIFLTISGLLILIAFIGSANAISRTRFNDGMRSMQVHLQQQYNDVQTGLNLRDPSASNIPARCGATPVEVGKSDCLLLGRLVHFDNSSIKSYLVIGSKDVAYSEGQGEGALLKDHNLEYIPSSEVKFDYPWGIERNMSCMAVGNVSLGQQVLGNCTSSPAAQFDSYLIVRSPRSGNISTYVFQSNGLNRSGTTNTINLEGPQGYLNFLAPGDSLGAANICFKSADLIGVLYGGVQVGGRMTAGQIGNKIDSGMSKSDMEAACGNM